MARGVKKPEKTPEDKADYDPFYVALGERFKALRDAKKLSQRQLAARAGVSPAYIWLVETGGQNMTLSVFRRLCEVLDVTMVRMLTFGDAELAPSRETLGHLVGSLERVSDKLEGRIEQEAQILDEMRGLSSEVRRFLEAVYKERGAASDVP